MSDITIDGTEYPTAALSDDAKGQLISLQTARNAYANRLKALLPISLDSLPENSIK